MGNRDTAELVEDHACPGPLLAVVFLAVLPSRLVPGRSMIGQVQGTQRDGAQRAKSSTGQGTAENPARCHSTEIARDRVKVVGIHAGFISLQRRPEFRRRLGHPGGAQPALARAQISVLITGF
jgi:hypothetical protein